MEVLPQSSCIHLLLFVNGLVGHVYGRKGEVFGIALSLGQVLLCELHFSCDECDSDPALWGCCEVSTMEASK